MTFFKIRCKGTAFFWYMQGFLLFLVKKVPKWFENERERKNPCHAGDRDERVWRGSAKKWTAMSGQFNCPVMKERSSAPLCHKDTAFIPYIHARVLCFLAYYRNKKMQHAENQHVARFVSWFETFRTCTILRFLFHTELIYNFLLRFLG